MPLAPKIICPLPDHQAPYEDCTLKPTVVLSKLLITTFPPAPPTPATNPIEPLVEMSALVVI